MENIVEICMTLRKIAETMFGPSRTDWTLGDTYFADGNPCIVYLPAEGVIEIQLSRRAENDTLQLVYQLAHEVCHTLHPSRDGDSLVEEPTLVMNEGISTWFSCYICEKFGFGEVARESTMKTSYAKPMRLVEELLQMDAQAITKLRAFQPWLDRLVPSDFIEAGVCVPSELAQALCEPF